MHEKILILTLGFIAGFIAMHMIHAEKLFGMY